MTTDGKPGRTQMMQPNWFDKEFTASMNAQPLPDAVKCLELIAQDARIIQELQTALDHFDANPVQPGPSRTQVVRQAIENVLQATQ